MAVENPEGQRGYSKEVHRRHRVSMVPEKNQPVPGWIGILFARLTQRDTVSSEILKPSLSNSPWMRGAPQVGFSATIRKISSRTSLPIGFLPNGILRRESHVQYKRKPVRCQRMTVWGVTRISDVLQPGQIFLKATQKSLSKEPSRGRGRLA